MKFLLRLKAWQLFILLTSLYLIPLPPLYFLYMFPAWLVIYIGWVYSIGVTMHSFIPQNKQPKIQFFKFSCVFILLCSVVLALVSYLGWIWVIPVVLCYLVGLVYILGFAARMLESVIEGEIVNVSDSLKALVSFWVFPLGVWHIQPAVKRVLESRKMVVL